MATNVAGMSKVPELRKRILFTLLLLAIYRIGIFVVIPFVNKGIIGQNLSDQSFWGFFNMFSGGGLEQMSIFALGVMPYISASIVMQLLTVIVPSFDQLQKEGEQGRKKINQYTRYAGILVALVQGFFVSRWLLNLPMSEGVSAVIQTGGKISFYLITMLILVTGTAFVMWLGEQISERGIGNGTSLIIFAGIVARLPAHLQQLFTSTNYNLSQLLLIALVVVTVIAVVVFFERGYRKLPVEYAKRIVGQKLYGGQTSYLPLKLNIAGVIPPLFASALLMFPLQAAESLNWAWLNSIKGFLDPGSVLYNVLYVALIIFFCYFYTAVTFNPIDVADNLKKNGGFIPGIRPGKATAEYLDKILSRLTFGGALYIAAVCVLPNFLRQKLAISFYLGGTSLLIVVGVALDTVQKIQEYLISHNYTGLAGAMNARTGIRPLRTR